MTHVAASADTRIRSILAVLAVGFGASIAGAQAPAPLAFVPDRFALPATAPDPDDPRNVMIAGIPRLDGATWTLDGPTLSMRLQLVDAADRLRFITATTGVEIDPFGGRPDRPPRFISFLLRLENRGTTDILFHPHSAWLASGREILNPVGLEELRGRYGMVAEPFPPAYERARLAVLDASHSLAPGASLAGLLIYRVPRAQTKRFTFDMRVTLPEGPLVRLVAPYIREDLERAQAAKAARKAAKKKKRM